MSTPTLLQRLAAPGQSSRPRHNLADDVRNDNGVGLTYVEFTEAVVAGDAVTGTLLEQDNEGHANNIADAKVYQTTTATPFTVEVRNVKSGLITTAAVPRIGSVIHVHDDTGEEQFAITGNPQTTKILTIADIQNGGAGWVTALDIAVAFDTDVRFITPGLVRKADSDLATYAALPIMGFAQRAYAAGDFGWVVNEGLCIAKVLSTPAIGSPLVKSATAGSVRMARMYGSETKDFDSIADQADDIEEVTVTGAIVGDMCQIGLSTISTLSLVASAQVSSAGTVQVVLSNNSGGAIDAASGTLAVGVTAMQSFTNPDCGVVVSAASTSGDLCLIYAMCGQMVGAQMPFVVKDA